MSESRKRILEMLSEGKIDADEAERLLEALNSSGASASTAPDDQAESAKSATGACNPKYLHVQVEAAPGHHSGHESVNIKIPLALLKTGMKLKGLLPAKTRDKISKHLGEKGIDLDLNDLDAEKVNCLIAALCDASIDIDADQEKVRIYCA